MADGIDHFCPECGARRAKNRQNCWLCDHEFVTERTEHVQTSSRRNNKLQLATATVLTLALLPAVAIAFLTGCTAGLVIEESGWGPNLPLGKLTFFMAITSAVIVAAVFVVGILQASMPGLIWKEKSGRLPRDE
jgi:hypothetical protein